jgi:site-specific recombinase XerC
MINRENWKAVNKYLKYRSEVDQISEESKRLEKGWLLHLLLWAQEKSFSQASKIRPTFPEFILNSRLDGKDRPLSQSFVRKSISSSRCFLRWLSIHEQGYRKITPAWLETIKSPRMTIKLRSHENVTIDEVNAIASAPVLETWEKRIRAAAVFWFLSGIRIGAFTTLPLKAVDVKKRRVLQLQNLGVRTKNQKDAVTYLFDISNLLDVINAWDDEVRSVCPEDGLWFAMISPKTGEIDPLAHVKAGKHRDCRARKDLKRWLTKVELPYHSPHKFRHGHATYGLKNAKDIGELKAVSQNLMHSNLSITDGIYGMLSDDDIQQRIDNISKVTHGEINQNKEEIKKQFMEIIANL